MLREQPYTFYGISGTVNPTTRQISEQEAITKAIPSKKVANNRKNYPPDSQRLFVDDEFRCVPSDLDGVDGSQKLVWCRLGQLVNPRGSLFESNYFSNYAQMPANPSFLNEVGLLPPFYYQSLFLTPDFTSNGQYRLILNIQGQFRQIIVDDIIPVYQINMQPIWGLDKEVPWELIVLKAWAKVCGGFRGVVTARPFEFLRTFSYPDWRMKNLDKFDFQGAWRFLGTKLQGDQAQFQAPRVSQSNPLTDEQGLSHTKSNYVLRPGQRQFTVIAKTKNSQKVGQCGLMPNAAAYQVTKLLRINGKHAVKLASSIKNRWNGQFSVLDRNVNQIYDQNIHNITLSKSFIMPFEDFKKVFGLMLISPMNYKNFMTTKQSGYVVDVPAGWKKAQYFRIVVKQQGKFDFSIIQARQNQVPNIPKPMNQQSGLMMNRSSSANRSLGGSQFLRPVSPLNTKPPQGMVPIPPPGPPSGPSSPVRPISPLNSSSRVMQASTNQFNQMNQMGQMNQMSHINQMGQINQMNQMNHQSQMGQMNHQSQMGQMNRQSQMGQMNQMSQMNRQSQMNHQSQMNQMNQMNMPMMKQTTQVMTTNAPVIDPWVNKNPWPGSPIIGMAENQSLLVRPPSNMGMMGGPVPPMGSKIANTNIPPSMHMRPTSQIATTTISGVQPQLDPWQNRNPWGSPPAMSGAYAPPFDPRMNGPIGASVDGIPGYLPISTNSSGSRPTSQVNIQSVPAVVQQTTTTIAGGPAMDPWMNHNPWSGPPTALGGLPPIPPPAINASMNHPQLMGYSSKNQSIAAGVAPLAFTATGTSPPPQPIAVSVPMGHSSFRKTESPTRVVDTTKVTNFSPGISVNIPADPWRNTNPWNNPPTFTNQPNAYGTNTFITGGPAMMHSPAPNFGTGSRVMMETTETTTLVGPPAVAPLSPRPMTVSPSTSNLVITAPSAAIIQPPPTAIQTTTTKFAGPSYGSAANDPMLLPMGRSPIAGNGVILANSAYHQGSGGIGTPVHALVETTVIDPWQNNNPWGGPPTAPMFSQGNYPQQVPASAYRGVRGGGGPQGQQKNYPSQHYQQNYFQGQGLPIGGGNQSQLTSNISNPVSSVIPQPQGIGISQIPQLPMHSLDNMTQRLANISSGRQSGNQQLDQAAAMLASGTVPSMNRQSPANQQLDKAAAMLVSKTAPMQKSMSSSNLSGLRYAPSSIVPQQVQPFQPPSSYRGPPAPMNNSANNPMMPFPPNGPPPNPMMSQQSPQMGMQSYTPMNNQLRFLKVKIVLVRVLPNRNNIASRIQRGSGALDPKSQPENGYEYVDIDETHGYTAGQAYFQKLIPGEYILHVKPQASAKPISYTINFISETPMDLRAIKMEKPDKSLLLRSAFLDFARATGPTTFLDQQRSEWISYGPIFNQCGYGYIAFCAEVNSPTKLYCEFHPGKLRSQGYICKDLYKLKNTQIGLFSQKGMGRCIILKRIRPDAPWPSKNILFYKAS